VEANLCRHLAAAAVDNFEDSSSSTLLSIPFSSILMLYEQQQQIFRERFINKTIKCFDKGMI